MADTENGSIPSSLQPSKAALPNWRRHLQRYGIVVAFVVLCIVLSIISPYFLATQNLLNVLRQSSINGILAMGMTFVILTRGIDLSVGSLAGLTGIVGASFVTTSSVAGLPGSPYSPALGIGAGILVGLVMGAVSGITVSRFKVPSFVVTLGMLSSARGLAMLYTDGRPVPSLTSSFRWIGTGQVFHVPVPILLLGVIYVVCWWVLGRTRYGRYVYAIGGNPRAATTSGINVDWIRFSVYVVSGGLAGVAGLLLAARTGAGLTQAGVSYELDAIAAVVIGGTSLSGGIGTVTGTLFGTLIIAVMNNGLDLLGVDSNYQQIIKGLMIVIAVLLDSSRSKDAE